MKKKEHPVLTQEQLLTKVTELGILFVREKHNYQAVSLEEIKQVLFPNIDVDITALKKRVINVSALSGSLDWDEELGIVGIVSEMVKDSLNKNDLYKPIRDTHELEQEKRRKVDEAKWEKTDRKDAKRNYYYMCLNHHCGKEVLKHHRLKHACV